MDAQENPRGMPWREFGFSARGSSVSSRFLSLSIALGRPWQRRRRLETPPNALEECSKATIACKIVRPIAVVRPRITTGSEACMEPHAILIAIFMTPTRLDREQILLTSIRSSEGGIIRSGNLLKVLIRPITHRAEK